MAENMSANTQETQPQPFSMTINAKRWSSGICDCFQDPSQCCFAFWCFPCFACKTSKEAGECLCLPLLDAFGLIPPMTTALRTSTRHRFDIEGTICDDCVHAFFCGPCTWYQISREIKMRHSPVLFVTTIAQS